MTNRFSVYRWLALFLILLAALPLALMARNAEAFDEETTPGEMAEVRASDLWFRTRPTRSPRPDMIIVARDEKTVEALGNPWHRHYGDVIRKLTAAGAKLIVLDLDVDDRQGRAADRALYTAIADSKRTVVMVRYKQDRAMEPDPDELRGLRALEKSSRWQEFAVTSATPEWGWLNFAPATSDFIHSAAGAGVAVTEQSMDPDQVMRRSRAGYLAKVLYPYDTKQGALTNFLTVVPNLPVTTSVLALGGNADSLQYRFGERLSLGGARTQPLSVKGFVTIDYIGPEGTYPRISMLDVLRSEPLSDRFKGRIVFIGSTIPDNDLTEYRVTPFGSRMPRVEMTANQVQQFLDERAVAEPYVFGLGSVMLLGLLLGLLVPQFRPVPALAAAVGSLLIYFVLGWFLFMTRSVMLPILPALILTPLALGIAGILGLLIRPFAVERVVEVRDTGMALNPGEPLPQPVRRRWSPFRRGPQA